MPIRSTDWEKRRVSILCLRPGGDLQMISATMLMQKHKPAQDGAPSTFHGPTYALWENTKHSFPGMFDALTFIGVLAALPPNVNEMEWAGHIDWVQPTDKPEHKLSEGNIIDAEYEVVKH
jgi:hypothetical protein